MATYVDYMMGYLEVDVRESLIIHGNAGHGRYFTVCHRVT